MYDALTWLAKRMKLRGRPDIVRILITEPLLEKLEVYGFKGEIPEKDRSTEK